MYQMKFYLTLILSLIAISSLGQKCRTTELNKVAPWDTSMLQEFERQWQLKQQLKSKTGNNDTSTYIVPVVFHIIHNKGVENISDSSVYQCLNNLNYDFANSDTNALFIRFKHLAADAHIEFRLATIDPNGDSTLGITRTYNIASVVGKPSIFDIIHWPHANYLNIYIVKNPDGAFGYAFYPGGPGNLDGVVLKYNKLSQVPTHEVGHWLHLHHIWGREGDPRTGNCGQDDEVDDTPPCNGTFECDSLNSTCGSYDNVQNYMDYSSCVKMFTKGQGKRMRSTLELTRTVIHTDSNVVNTGTDSLKQLQNIEFSILKTSSDYASLYEEVKFKSRVAPFRYEDSIRWSFTNATISHSSSVQPVLRFLESGWQLYELKIYKSDSLIYHIEDSILVKVPEISHTLSKCLGTPLLKAKYTSYAFDSYSADAVLFKSQNDSLMFNDVLDNELTLSLNHSGRYLIKFQLLFDSLYSFTIVDTLELASVNVNDSLHITFDTPLWLSEVGMYTETKGNGYGTAYPQGLGYDSSNCFAISTSQGIDTVSIIVPNVDLRKYKKAQISFDYAFGEANSKITNRLLSLNIFPSCNEDIKTELIAIVNDDLNTMNGVGTEDNSDWKRVSIQIDSPSYSNFSDLQFYLIYEGKASFYLDNIKITGELNTNEARAEFSLLGDSIGICLNEDLKLENLSNYGSYQPEWIVTGSENFTAYSDSLLLKPQNGDWYNVKLVVSNYFSIDTISRSFYVNILNHDTSSIQSLQDEYCQGQHTTIRLVGENDSVRWKLPNLSSKLNPVNYTNPSSGYLAIYTAYVYLNGCKDTVTKEVPLHTGISNLRIYANKDTVYLGYLTDSVKFSVSGNSIDTFIWNMDNGDFSNAFSFKYLYKNPGTYNVSLIGKNQYCADTVFKPIYVTEGFKVGVESLNDQSEFSIVPNPFDDYVTITAKQSFYSYQFELLNAVGQTILKQRIYSSPIDIRMLNLENGLYYYRIINANNGTMVSGKLIKR